MDNELYTSGPAYFTEEEMKKAILTFFRVNKIPVFASWQDHDEEIAARGMIVGKKFKIKFEEVTE